MRTDAKRASASRVIMIDWVSETQRTESNECHHGSNGVPLHGSSSSLTARGDLPNLGAFLALTGPEDGDTFGVIVDVLVGCCCSSNLTSSRVSLFRTPNRKMKQMSETTV